MIDLPEPGLTTPGPDARGLTGAVGPWLPGPLLFARFAPILSISETKALLPGAHGPEVGR